MRQKSTSEGNAQTWKEAWYEALHRGERPLKELADHLGVCRQLLQALGDEHQPNATLSSKHFPTLARLRTNLAWLDYLERQAGRVAFRLPTDHSDLQSLGVVIQEAGEWMKAHAAALEDGIVTEDEFRSVEKEWLDVVRAGTAAVEQLRGRVQVQRPSLREARR